MKAELINFELWHTYDSIYDAEKICQRKVELALADISSAIQTKNIDTVVGLLLLDGFLFSNNKYFYSALVQIEQGARALGIKNLYLLPGACPLGTYQEEINNRGMTYKIIPDYDVAAQQMFISYQGKDTYKWNANTGKFLFLGGVPDRANRIGLLSRYYDAGMLANAEWSFFPPWTDADKQWCRNYLRKYSDREYDEFIKFCSRAVDSKYEESKNYSRLTGKALVDAGVLYTSWIQDPSYIDPQIYRNTSLSILSKYEYSDANSHKYLGEKTWRAVINNHPFIVADNKPGERFDYMKSLGLETFDKFVVEQYGYIFDEETRLDAVVESTKIFMDAILTHCDEINDLIENNRKMFLSVIERNFKIQQWVKDALGVDSVSMNKWFNSKDYETFIRVPQ